MELKVGTVVRLMKQECAEKTCGLTIYTPMHKYFGTDVTIADLSGCKSHFKIRGDASNLWYDARWIKSVGAASRLDYHRDIRLIRLRVR